MAVDVHGAAGAQTQGMCHGKEQARSKDIILLPGATKMLDVCISFWEGAGSALAHSSSVQGQVGAVVLLLNPGITGSSKFDQIKSSHIAAFWANYLQHLGSV